MWHSLKGLLTATWNLSRVWDRILSILFIGLSLLAIWFSLQGDANFTQHKALWLAVLPLLYFFALIPPVAKMARSRHKYVLYVVLWGLISLSLVLLDFYLLYFALANTFEEQQRWEKILNLPPAMAAVAAAVIGWYAVTQFAAKNNRTNNSFSLVMQTRCNTEFMKNTSSLSLNWPTSVKMTRADDVYFPSTSRASWESLKTLCKSVDCTIADLNNLAAFDERLLLGAEAAKYLLNFYEFMAYGVHVGDLDEDLLYETISPAVVLLFNRADALREFLNGGPNGDTLAFQHLHRLVKGYKKMEAEKEIEVLGWERSLALERANLPLPIRS